MQKRMVIIAGQIMQVGMDVEVHLNKNSIHSFILTDLADS